MFDRVAIDIMINGADKNDPRGAHNHRKGEEPECKQRHTGDRIDQKEKRHARDGQQEQPKQLNNPEAERRPDAFAPFFLHHGRRTAESADGSQVLIGDDGDNEKGSDTPRGAKKPGNNLTQKADPVLDDAQDRANRCCKDSPGEYGADTADGKPKPIANCRPLTLEIQMRAMDQCGIEKDNDEIIDDIIAEKKQIPYNGALVGQVVDGENVPAGGGEQDHKKRSDDQQHRQTGENRKKDQLAVVFQDAETVHGKVPAIGKASKKVHTKIFGCLTKYNNNRNCPNFVNANLKAPLQATNRCLFP